MNTKQKVILNMYDLSQGMARQFSPMFLGKQIEAIWHTGLVVYGKEYYFGGGICAGTPKQTLYGYPIEEKELGETEIPQSVFEDFLRSISSKYTMENYDLFQNNCNNFTNECAQFLVGKNIPENITGLPQEFLNTQLGQMLKPIIEQITNRQAPQQIEHFNTQQQQAPQAKLTEQQNQEILQNLTQLLAQQQQNQPQPQPQQQPQNQNQPQPQSVVKSNVTTNDVHVTSIEDLETFTCLIDSSPKCIIDFYTNWCGPCKAIRPLFHKLASENPDINFYSVNIDNVRDLAEQLQVTSIPTFMIYKNGQRTDRWTGGNQQQLQSKIQQLK